MTGMLCRDWSQYTLTMPKVSCRAAVLQRHFCDRYLGQSTIEAVLVLRGCQYCCSNRLLLARLPVQLDNKPAKVTRDCLFDGIAACKERCGVRRQAVQLAQLHN